MTRSNKVFTVSTETLASHISALMQYLIDKGGYEAQTAQFSAYLKQLELHKPKQRIPIDVMAQNLDQLALWLEEPNLGLKLSPYSSRKQHRLAFFFAENRLSLIDYFRMLARYVCISSEVMHIELIASKEVIAFRIFPNCPQSVSIHQTEGFAASLCDIVKQARQIVPTSIDFVHTNPDANNCADTYKTMLGVVPQFDQPVTQILFKNATKDSISADQRPSKISFAQIQAMETLRRKEIGEEFWIDRCKFLLEILMYYGEPHKTVLAELLAVTSRTLQRRLESEGLTYRQLLNELRKELAVRHMMDRRLNSEDMAFLLGYQDVGQFNRAFKAWFGMPPGKYRGAVAGESQN